MDISNTPKDFLRLRSWLKPVQAQNIFWIGASHSAVTSGDGLHYGRVAEHRIPLPAGRSSDLSAEIWRGAKAPCANRTRGGMQSRAPASPDHAAHAPRAPRTPLAIGPRMCSSPRSHLFRRLRGSAARISAAWACSTMVSAGDSSIKGAFAVQAAK